VGRRLALQLAQVCLPAFGYCVDCSMGNLNKDYRSPGEVAIRSGGPMTRVRQGSSARGHGMMLTKANLVCRHPGADSLRYRSTLTYRGPEQSPSACKSRLQAGDLASRSWSEAVWW